MDPKHESFVYLSEVKFRAYIFGDRFLAARFRKAINAAIVDDIKSCVLNAYKFMRLIRNAYDNVPASCPIIQLLVDQFCDNWEERDDDEDSLVNALPDKFLSRAFRRFMQLKQASRKTKSAGISNMKRCYYEHITDAEKAKCGNLHMAYHGGKDFGNFG